MIVSFNTECRGGEGRKLQGLLDDQVRERIKGYADFLLTQEDTNEGFDGFVPLNSCEGEAYEDGWGTGEGTHFLNKIYVSNRLRGDVINIEKYAIKSDEFRDLCPVAGFVPRCAALFANLGFHLFVVPCFFRKLRLVNPPFFLWVGGLLFF